MKNGQKEEKEKEIPGTGQDHHIMTGKLSFSWHLAAGYVLEGG